MKNGSPMSNITQENENFSREWLTFFEKSDFSETPSYDLTVNYFLKFVFNTPYAKMFNFGITPQGRELKYLVVSKDKAFRPEQAKQTGKAIVLIQNCIHAGETEGKDASMLLLREILVTKELEHLLDNLILVVILAFNLDGHERMSPFNRPNQNGPHETGWRVTSQNYNLNRDYMKAATPEMKDWLRLFNNWLPDFLIDNHTTNGADYQYHITYSVEKHQNIYHKTRYWLNEFFLPYVTSRVEKEGYLTAPYVELKGEKVTDGIIDWGGLPRFSTGYMALQNRPSLLVEAHSLKNYETRVFATKSMNKASLEFINNHFKELIEINSAADENVIAEYHINKAHFPLVLKGTEKFTPFMFKGFKSFEEESEILGAEVIRYTDEPEEFEIPLYNHVEVVETVQAPYAYLIPKEFRYIIDIIKSHGIEFKRIQKRLRLLVQRYRFKDVTFRGVPYEGCLMPDFILKSFRERVEIPKGTYVVFTRQRSLRVILNLLEPLAPDSLVRWGYFNSFFEKKEYAEAYVFEPIAQRMLEENQFLKVEFLKKLETDEEFRESPALRLDFFYKRSRYVDKVEKVYPIMKVNEKMKLI